MRKICAKLVPKISPPNKRKTEGMCALNASKTTEKFFKHVITGDESWILEYDPETKRQSSEWHGRNSPRPKKGRISKSKLKSTLICFFDVKVLFRTNSCLKDKQLINSTIVRPLKDSEKVFIVSGQRYGHLMLHHDNAPLYVHCHLRERIFDQKWYSIGSAASILA